MAELVEEGSGEGHVVTCANKGVCVLHLRVLKSYLTSVTWKKVSATSWTRNDVFSREISGLGTVLLNVPPPEIVCTERTSATEHL